jgi:hypothetical protein
LYGKAPLDFRPGGRCPGGSVSSLGGEPDSVVACCYFLSEQILLGRLWVNDPHRGLDAATFTASHDPASLGLLMTDSVTLATVEIFAEPHKGDAERLPRIKVAAGQGLSNSPMSSAPGWSPILGFPARRLRRT